MITVQHDMHIVGTQKNTNQVERDSFQAQTDLISRCFTLY